MLNQIKFRTNRLLAAVRASFASKQAFAEDLPNTTMHNTEVNHKEFNIKPFVMLGVVGALGYALYTHPPMKSVGSNEIALRNNQFTGSVDQVRDSMVLVIPGVHSMHRYSLQDSVYTPEDSSKANGNAPFQSIEGLSIGIDVAVRYALDPTKIMSKAKNYPDDIESQIVMPTVQNALNKTISRYSVREIFSSKRAEIQQAIETDIKLKLAADGIILRNVQMGRVDLPADYKAGMDKMLAEELESEKMRYTLDLKEKQIKQIALEADGEKIKREKAAEAIGNEQIIAAKAQAEAMKHILPFKQKQIEQRQLEAEAEKVSRIKTAEGSAQARVIEAVGEADSRHKLADVEAYRMDLVGKVASAQMERDGNLVTKHPLLIQKIMAEKLSDKISVIIAAPPTDGSFIGSALLGGTKQSMPDTTPVAARSVAAPAEYEAE